MFRGDPSHRGAFPDRRTPAWKVRWTAELGERIDASAVIDDAERVIVATRKGLVVALSLSDGARAGQLRLPGGVWSSPALVGGVLVVACDDGVIRGVDTSGWKLVWERRAPSKAFSGTTYAAGRVWLTSGKTLLAIDPFSGAVKLEYELAGSSFTAPAIDEARDRVVVGDRKGNVVALSASGGERVWTAVTTPGAHNDGSPAIAGDLVILGSNDRGVHAFDLASGELRWKLIGKDWMVSTPAVVGDTLYIGDDGGLLRALAVEDGSLRWIAKVGDDLASSPTLVGELIVHGAHDSKLHAHNSDGSSLAPIDGGAKIYASAAVSVAGVIVIGTQGGRVIAVE